MHVFCIILYAKRREKKNREKRDNVKENTRQRDVQTKANCIAIGK